MEATTALLELLLIIAIALATPGPNPLTVFAHSGLFGKKSNIPLITGIAIGLFIMQFSVGLAIDSLSENETALVTLHWVGMLFLLVMAVAIFKLDFSSLNVSESTGKIGLKTGICMQFVNGKEWAFIILIMSQFIEPLGGGVVGILSIIVVTMSICILAMIAWTFFGARLSGLFSDEKYGPRIFKICGSLLSLLWVAFLIRGPTV
ncbi:MAG: LysE family transporter [Euryarchaeota archaeon]|jgi:threonine/homoserine/homoserine lactone efflux protein|nr:LysE family transporter [Euryarchaeota archaeon]